MTNNPSPPFPDDRGAPFPVTPVPPDLLAWARQTLDIDAVMAEMRAAQLSGGVPFEDIVAELETLMRDES